MMLHSQGSSLYRARRQHLDFTWCFGSYHGVSITSGHRHSWVVQSHFHSGPHPFISLITPIKGKRLLNRVMRYFSHEQVMQTIMLLASRFSQLDVAVNADLLDTLNDSPERHEVLQQTQAFELNVIQSVFPASASANLMAINGMFGLLLQENDITTVVRTRVSFLLIFRSCDLLTIL